jgi:DNA-binding MarR family transcriptional regulator
MLKDAGVRADRAAGAPVGVDAVEDFVNAYVDSFTTWDILSLFGSTPGESVMPGDIAQLVGRPEPAVDTCLRRLVEKGFFVAEPGRGARRYVWSPSPELERSLTAFIKATSDRRGRLRALSLLLRKLGTGGSRDRPD